jgi:hypothetical protein
MCIIYYIDFGVKCSKVLPQAEQPNYTHALCQSVVLSAKHHGGMSLVAQLELPFGHSSS